MLAFMAIDTIEYGGWQGCARLSNGEVELVVPAAIGPRVIRYGFVGGQNLFQNYASQMGRSGEAHWQIRGGHRLWVAPENVPLSYALDNGPVHIEGGDLRLTVTQPVEPESGLEKQIAIEMAPQGTAVTLRHRLTNRNPWTVRYAAWALSVMRTGGTAIAGFPPRARHDERLLATNPLVMWGYTDFSDPRWRFTPRFVLLRQDDQATVAQKTGLFAEDTCLAYSVGGELFVKRALAVEGVEYPDFGCSMEMFTNHEMLEMETLSPLASVAPGGSVEHVEHWNLARTPDLSNAGDEELGRVFTALPK
jgi:hypothetical protein